jgi:hypothetical protein
MSQKSHIETLVEAGLRALAEQDKIPPSERFDRLVRAGIIDERGRVLHLDESASDEGEISIRELRTLLAAG